MQGINCAIRLTTHTHSGIWVQAAHAAVHLTRSYRLVFCRNASGTHAQLIQTFLSVMSVTDACGQVVEAMHAKEDDSQIPLKPLEAMLSIDLAHPNIIHTYKFYTRIRQVRQQLIS